MKSILKLLNFLLLLFILKPGVAQQPQLVLPVEHSTSINRASLSPDGKYIVTISGEQTIKIWDADNGKLLHNLEGDIGSVDQVIFSPDSKSIVSTSGDSENTGRDNITKIWDIKSGRLLYSLVSYHTWYISTASFSPDSKYVLAQSDNYIPVIIDVQHNMLLHKLKGHKGMGYAEYSPDGKFIVGLSSFKFVNIVNIWNAQSGQLLYRLKSHKGEVIEIVNFRQDSKSIYIAALKSDKYHTIQILDLQSGRLNTILQFNKEYVDFAYFSPDGNCFYTVNFSWQDERLDSTKIWDTQSGRLLHRLEGTAASGFPHSNSSFSPDGKGIATVSNNTFKIWDVESGSLMKTIPLNDPLFDLNWIQNRIITGQNSKVSIFDLETGKQLLSWIAIDSIDWVVTHPSGLFDASPGAMYYIYFSQNGKKIELDSLKDKNYEPGLWEKVMSGKPLRAVEN